MFNNNHPKFMFGIIPKIKRLFSEPKIYALVVQSKNGAILHLGVHYSLDEAVNAATPTLIEVADHQPGEHTTIDMWTSLQLQDVIHNFTIPDVSKETKEQTDGKISTTNTKELKPVEKPLSLEGQIKIFRATKNKLMSTLIKNGDFDAVEQAKDLLSKPEKALIINKITNGGFSNNKSKTK